MPVGTPPDVDVVPRSSVQGPVDGGEVTVTVTPLTPSGEVLASDPSTAVTVPARAHAPTDVTAVPGDGDVTVSWTPPADSGSFPVTGYEVHLDDGTGGSTVQVGAVTSVVVTGLTNGVEHAAVVAAVTDAGVGERPLPSDRVIPGVVPGAWDRPGGCLFHPRCARADGVCESRRPELARIDAGRVRCHHPLVHGPGS